MNSAIIIIILILFVPILETKRALKKIEKSVNKPRVLNSSKNYFSILLKK